MSKKSEIYIPHPKTRKALLVVDMEPKYMTRQTRSTIKAVSYILTHFKYDLYIIAEYSKNTGLKGNHKITVSSAAKKHIELDKKALTELRSLLEDEKVLNVVKATRSLFGNTAKLATLLRRHKIKEVHIVGVETHDCILATALDAFDHEFVTCVIEEACRSKNLNNHKYALAILRQLQLTNHSIKI